MQGTARSTSAASNAYIFPAGLHVPLRSFNFEDSKEAGTAGNTLRAALPTSAAYVSSRTLPQESDVLHKQHADDGMVLVSNLRCSYCHGHEDTLISISRVVIQWLAAKGILRTLVMPFSVRAARMVPGRI